MASVNEVYSALKNLANKDERGFITPKVFNTFTTVAQNKIFNDLFNELTKAQTLRARNVDAKMHHSYTKRLEEDLAYSLRSLILAKLTVYLLSQMTWHVLYL